jgi:hypothetical protein
MEKAPSSFLKTILSGLLVTVVGGLVLAFILREGPFATSCPEGSGPFAGLWPNVQAKIGCAKGPDLTTWAAEQPFQHGWMIWRGDEKWIYVLYDDNTWADYEDTFHDEKAAAMPTPVPPLREPERGFGKVWRDHPVVQERLGGATEDERGCDATVQHFERGFMLQSDRWTWVLYQDRSWERPDAK